MAGDQRHVVAGHLVGDGHRLFRVAGVVADLEIELLAEHAARGIDVFDGQPAAILHLRAERCILTGNWADHGDRCRLVFLASPTARGNRGYT
jgi:hypothetical protein